MPDDMHTFHPVYHVFPLYAHLCSSSVCSRLQSVRTSRCPSQGALYYNLYQYVLGRDKLETKQENTTLRQQQRQQPPLPPLMSKLPVHTPHKHSTDVCCDAPDKVFFLCPQIGAAYGDDVLDQEMLEAALDQEMLEAASDVERQGENTCIHTYTLVPHTHTHSHTPHTDNLPMLSFVNNHILLFISHQRITIKVIVLGDIKGEYGA